MNETDLQNLVAMSFRPNLLRGEIYEILGELSSKSGKKNDFILKYISRIVDEKLPINEYLEYGLYKLLEDRGLSSQDHYPRKVELCNVISEKITADAVRYSNELVRTDSSNLNYLLLHALALLHNYRPLEAWPYAVRAAELFPQEIAGYNLLIDIAQRMNRPRFSEEILEIFEKTRTDKLQVDILRQNNFKFLQNASKKLPAILINTQMKSGTVYLRGLFSSMLRVPHCQVALTGIVSEGATYPLKNWLRDFSAGGAVCADHFDINENSLKDLSNAGIKRLVVHTRDLRKAALSSLHFQKSQAKYSGVVGTFSGDSFGDFKSLDYKFESHCQHFIPRWQKWLKNWIKVSHSSDINILFTRYEDFALNEIDFIKNILNFYDISDLYRKLDVSDVHKLHFRSGDADEYNRVISKEVRLRVNKLIDPEVMERFGWESAS